MSPLCTCPEAWHGQGERPPCAVHEGGEPPPGYGRRKDGTLCRVAATVAGYRLARDPEGMGTAREWYPWP
jgi:hypothetical protein